MSIQISTQRFLYSHRALQCRAQPNTAERHVHPMKKRTASRGSAERSAVHGERREQGHTLGDVRACTRQVRAASASLPCLHNARASITVLTRQKSIRVARLIFSSSGSHRMSTEMVMTGTPSRKLNTRGAAVKKFAFVAMRSVNERERERGLLLWKYIGMNAEARFARLESP